MRTNDFRTVVGQRLHKNLSRISKTFGRSAYKYIFVGDHITALIQKQDDKVLLNCITNMIHQPFAQYLRFIVDHTLLTHPIFRNTLA